MQSEHYLQDAMNQFRRLKELADKAVAQVAEEDLFTTLDTESNSIATILKHLAGNMRSRWTDFLTSDGEKSDRNRDAEFVMEKGDTRERVRERSELGWECLFAAVKSLAPEDLERTVFIRGEPHTVLQAINRQLTHVAYHVGQILFLAKHFTEGKWQPLSIPRGKSEEFNAAMRKKVIKGGSN